MNQREIKLVFRYFVSGSVIKGVVHGLACSIESDARGRLRKHEKSVRVIRGDNREEH